MFEVGCWFYEMSLSLYVVVKIRSGIRGGDLGFRGMDFNVFMDKFGR